MLLDAAFEGAPPERDQITAFHAVLERLGMPEMTDESLVAFINATREAYNGLTR